MPDFGDSGIICQLAITHVTQRLYFPPKYHQGQMILGSPGSLVFRGRGNENIENPTLAGLLCVLAHFAVVFPRSQVSGVRVAPQA